MQIRVRAKRPDVENVGQRRSGEPVTFGVPLPAGVVSDAHSWSITDAANTTTPVQVRTLDRWPDGSLRWALVDARVDAEGTGDAALHINCGSMPFESPLRPLVVAEDDGGVTVDTGAARFVMRPGRRVPFDSIDIAGRAVLGQGGGLAITDAAGIACAVSLDTVSVEETGPLRAALRADGRVRRNGRTILQLILRVDLYAGLATARLRLCVRNPERAVHRDGFWDLGDTGSVLLKNLSISFALSPEAGEPRVRCSREVGLPWEEFQAPFEMYQDSSGGENWQSTNHINRNRIIPTTFRGYRVTSGSAAVQGLRATPLVAARTGSERLAVSVPHFWQNFPAAVEVTDPFVILRFLPPQSADVHEIQGGEQKTFECFLSVSEEHISAEPLEWARSPTVICPDPDWVIATGAVPFLEQLAPEHAGLVNAAVDGPHRFEIKREVIDEYGWRHFGEIYGDHEAVRHSGPQPLVSHYNNQYDAIAGLAYQFLRTADPRWRRMMTELAAHVVDIDVYHTARDKWAYNHGMFWHTYHYGDADTATHRTYPRSARGRVHGGGPSADHNYTTGLMLHYFLTGSEASREAVVDAAQFVIDMDDGDQTVFRWLAGGDTGEAARSAFGYYGPGRGPANSLNALVDGYRVSGDLRFLVKAERLIRRVIHPNEVIAERGLDVPEQRWFYTMFLQSLGKYLHSKIERTELDVMYAYARQSLLHYGRWMAANEYPYLDKPEKLEFPTETWAAQDIRKSDVFYFAAMHSSGDERSRFLERARYFYDYSVSTLNKMATRSLARPIVILLTSGFLHSWSQRHPDFAAPPPRQNAEFGEPEAFVPQRERAKRRAVLLAVAGGLATVGAIIGFWAISSP